jgi:hypothetical protein
VAQSAIATQIHQSLDIHGDFPAQITFYRELSYLGAQRIHLLFSQVTDLVVLLDSRRGTQALRLRTAHTEDVGQRNYRMFMIWYIDTGYTSH